MTNESAATLAAETVVVVPLRPHHYVDDECPERHSAGRAV